LNSKEIIQGKNIMRKVIIAVSLLVTSVNINAELIDRGNGMIYDSVQNITWLANASYFAESTTPRFDKDRDGWTDWESAMKWAASLKYGGFRDWRLPTGDINCQILQPCTTGELGHLFYNELGGIHGISIYSSSDPDLALFSNIESNLSPFIIYYWTSTQVPDISLFGTNRLLSQTFSFDNGEAQNFDSSYAFHAVWAVRDGDVAQAVN